MNSSFSKPKRIAAIIEARMTSSRLPGKVLMDVCGKPALQHLVDRLRQVETIDDIVIATTYNFDDDPVHALAEQLGVLCYRGSESDVLGRVLGAAKTFSVDVIVEITADCPLLDPQISARCIDAYFDSGSDYVCIDTGSYPSGLETQVFATSVLSEVDASHRDDPDAREHVSLPIYQQGSPYKLHYLQPSGEHLWPGLRLDLDTAEDYAFISAIYQALYAEDPYFGLSKILKLLDDPGFSMHRHRPVTG
ncbi:NTP transferase domain-containing protein [Mariprofundus sp. NF]|uniref:cytidylyltransferase domain-containing protein n=1 Tax=Mariprofundus sp. NF TaxID=2608716 RepID=UPI0015A4C73F|nr:glycosyltransferase family protein [Mariprofundus sp. NF]NWF37927.1 NTP transferase domain-containing protein [Mariprofundus sp. NF]